jgi:hypothetical protein
MSLRSFGLLPSGSSNVTPYSQRPHARAVESITLTEHALEIDFLRGNHAVADDKSIASHGF